MKILAIETSCDETAIAIIEASSQNLESESVEFKILANIVSSQIKVHAPYGGVVPNLAKREHRKNLPVLLKQAVKKLQSTNNKLQTNIDTIAVTSGPGLEPALWEGINFAENLSKEWKIPLVPVNHLEGHIYSALMKPDTFSIPNKSIFPLLTLIVSGGHTELVLSKKHLDYTVLGETLDDAAGEAFDKVGRMLGLPFPGGPEISKLAKKGDPKAIAFPRPMINSKDLNFSFSGLKTSVLYKLKDFKASKEFGDEISGWGRAARNKSLPLASGVKEISRANTLRANIAASFEQAVVDVLVKKTLNAIEKHKPKTVALGGGVAANDKLREELNRQLQTANYKSHFLLPEKMFTGDNAAMIAVAAYFKALNKKYTKPEAITAKGNLRL